MVKKEKWLEFNHVDCKTEEKEVNYAKNKESTDENYLSPGQSMLLELSLSLEQWTTRLVEKKES